MPLGMEVDFGPGHIMLDGDAAFSSKGAQPLIFGPYLLWPKGAQQKKDTAPPLSGPRLLWSNGWMPLGTEVDLGPGHIVIVLDWDQLPPKGAQQPPFFGPCLLWPRSPIH